MKKIQTRQMFIDGRWVNADSGTDFRVTNPANGETCFQVPDARSTDVVAAVNAAQAAFAKWSALPHTQRAAYFYAAAQVLRKKQDELANILTDEGGGWIGKSLFEVGSAVNILHAAAAMTYQSTGEVLPSEHGKVSMAVRKPLGVVGIISPWNFPLLLSLRSAAFALAAGNTVVLKPSEETPVSGGLSIAELFEAVGLPPGVFNVVTCSRERVAEVGQELVTNTSVKGISFTGSTAVGREIAATAGGLLKKVCVELGGKDPLLVLADADLERAIKATVFGAFMHQGQICMSVERVFVHRSIAEPFLQGVVARTQGLRVGDPRQKENVIGPIINQRQLDRIHAHVEDAKRRGATIDTGGTYDGLYYRPTVISAVTPDMLVFREETFGPVAAIVTVASDDEAVELANTSDYGLSAGIITQDESRGLEIAGRLQSGMVHINDCSVYDEPHAPFGGIKQSGLGRHGGRWTMEAFTETHWITLERGGRHYPF